MRILHLLHRSIPGTHGYAIRSLEIIDQQLAKGLKPLVVTSPSQAPLGKLDSEYSEMIHGVRYFRSCGRFLAPYVEVYDPSPVRSSLRVLQNLSLLRMTVKVAKTYKPAIIHAHSPFTCGICGGLAGHWLGIPTVYEMRGLWEDSRTSRYGLSERSFRYRLVRNLENVALNKANRCVVISESLRSEVLERGVPAEKISIVPNGVDVHKFVPGPPPEELLRSLQLENKTIMGYVGSFFQYEGLDLLIEAMSLLMPDFPNLVLLLVGDGESMPMLKKIASEAMDPSRIVFTGRISYDRVADFYRLFDFLVLPRRKAREATLVTPLKPLEIMSMAKALVASDVGGHLEIVKDGLNGVLFESGSVTSLVSQCRRLLENCQFRGDLALRSRTWVEANRDWAVLIERYVDIYEGLVPR